MRCANCGAQLPPGRGVCPRCGRGAARKPAPAAHLYRDRRRRLRRARRLRLTLAAAALVALALLMLTGGPFRGRPAPPAPTPEPTPTPTPAPTPLPYDGVYAPIANIATAEDLVRLYRWMIESGHPTAYLESLEISDLELGDITDKFSNYFERFNYSHEPPAVRVEFKTGLRALQAIEAGDLSALDEDARWVAEQAQAAVAELIRPGMTDWEKELALHDYVVGHCDYALDLLAPHNGDALGFFRYGECRCPGYCDAFRLLGRLAGLEVEMIGGPTSRDDAMTKGHAWNLVRLNGLWYVVDTVWDDLIEAEPTVEHTFFNIPFACFGDTRSCDARCLPEGEQAVALDDQYYFNRPQYLADTVEAAVELAVRQLDAGGTAYVLLPEKDMARGVSEALARHYGRKGQCFELSEDLDINLYRFRL